MRFRPGLTPENAGGAAAIMGVWGCLHHHHCALSGGVFRYRLSINGGSVAFSAGVPRPSLPCYAVAMRRYYSLIGYML